jgi:glutathione S-transferase
MKLYYSPGACSLSPHIVILEAGLSAQLEKVDLVGKKTASGADYLTVNAKGAVPALQLEGGEVLTEGPAIVQYLADQKPDSGLAPRAGTLERYRLMEILNYITSELHKSYGPLFNPKISADWRASIIAGFDKKFAWVSKLLENKPYLMGNTFTWRTPTSSRCCAGRRASASISRSGRRSPPTPREWSSAPRCSRRSRTRD